MRKPPFILSSTLLALAASVALVATARASDPHGESAHGEAAHGEAKESKPSLKPDLKAKVEGKAEGKGERKGEGKPEAKSEVKGDLKGDAKGDSKGGEARASVSMSELRDLIDQKIAEVRTKREAAPVLKVQARAPRPKPQTGMMNAVYAPDAAPNVEAHGRGAEAPAGGARRPAVRDTKGALMPLSGVPAGHGISGHDVHWAYGGDTGPESWAQLKPEFQQCAVGKRQSPIDIRDSIAVQLDPIQFDYHPSAFRVIDNGHTVQVNVEPGNSITVQGRRYDLQQFHFHRPSEERINGRQFEMVAHLVHKDVEGKLAVVAVLMDQGKAHPLVQQVWNNLPLEKNIEQPALVQMDLKALLPEQQQYFTYMGSLTTPPCSEGVLWMVMKQPAAMSREQIAIFSKLYPMNARPIQSASGRLIKEGQ